MFDINSLIAVLNKIRDAIAGSPTYVISSSITSAENETPTGAIDGSNTVFTLAHTPNPSASLQIYLNGMLQTVGEDYTLATATITFSNAPLTNGILRVFYKY